MTRILLQIAVVLFLTLSIMALAPAHASPTAGADGVTVSINVPTEAAEGQSFVARVMIDNVVDFDACNYDVTYDPAVLEVPNLPDSVTSGLVSGVTIPVDMWGFPPPETQGTIRVIQNVPGLDGVSGAGYLAEIRFHVVGSVDNTSTIVPHDGVFSDKNAGQILTTYIGSSVHIIAPDAVAETDMGQEIADDNMALIPVQVVRVKNSGPGETIPIADGIGAYEASVEFDSAGIQILDVRGAGLFTSPTKELTVSSQATFSDSHSEATGPTSGTVAYLVPRLLGSANAPYILTLTFLNISDVATGSSIPQETPVVKTYLRGDAMSNGDVDIADALFIAQYLAHLRPLSDLNAVNGASVKWDDGGDVLNIADALFIAQYKALLRDANYNLK